MPYIQNLNRIEQHEIEDLDLCLKLETILHNFGIKTYKVMKINTDASNRYYYRIFTKEKSYIFMDSRKEPESFKTFLNIANFLLKNGLRAPKIYAKDINNNTLLLEDFGDLSFTQYLAATPQNETEIYSLAIDVLNKIHSLDVDIAIGEQNEELLNKGLTIFLDWYIAKKFNEQEAAKISRKIFEVFSELYPYIQKLPTMLVLRDFHADNLMWIEDAQGLNHIGLLDFQDAMLGSPVYDLISLLEDARRDIQPQTVKFCKTKFFSMCKHVDMSTLEDAYVIISAQRNLRIIGVFNRLHLRDGKSRYLSYLPRVWGYIEESIKHPILQPLREIFEQYNLYDHK